MIRIAVVDDHASSRQLLCEYLTKFRAEYDQQLIVEEFADGSDLVGHYTPNFDIIFLDVQMENLDGLAAARLVREVDPAVIIIFVTNMVQFAVKGYQVNALNYLVKPVSYFAFSQEMLRAVQRIEQTRDDFVVVPVAGELVKINLAKVVYIESVKHRLEIHTLDGKLSMVGTLREMAEQLEHRGFVRINSFLLANLRHVLAYGNQSAIMSQGTQLPVSRSRKKELATALAAYSGRARVL
ncbi:MAG: LytTR family DNA-binding domain-containing protein [Acidobacteriota bacterium]|nr:LytTR family DNA-binding domain-containing protein [Acidobacteriota bacterium]